MIKSKKYRNEVEAAVKIFRPVLVALKIREPSQHRPPVFIADFDHLHLLDLDFCSIEVRIADLGECTGMFISAYTKSKLLRNYIILNKSLFDTPEQETKEQLKITGVHEFCHFLAILYAVTSFSVDALKERILLRLNKRIDQLPKENLIKIYNLLSNKVFQEDHSIDELTDKHFRLEIEGESPDYGTLFYHFMFSKDLFETEFTVEKQAAFKQLIETKDKQDIEKAVDLLMDAIVKVAKEKWVPIRFAVNQVLKWIYAYT